MLSLKYEPSEDNKFGNGTVLSSGFTENKRFKNKKLDDLDEGLSIRP